MTIPLVQNFTLDVTSMATAADYSAIAFEAPYAGTVQSVRYIPNGTQAGGAIANSRILTLYNRKSGAGTGTTAVAQMALTSSGAVGLTDNVPASLTMTTSALCVAASGDIFEWETLHRTTGLPDPGGKVVIRFSRS